MNGIEYLGGGGGGGNVDDVYVNGTSVLDSDKIAQITSYKEITRAEYEALPSSKLTDGILYAIKDYNPETVGSFPPLIYSTQEREVGIWIDGKPLYQKTYHLASPLSVPTNSWTDTGISNAGMQKIIFGFGNDEFDNGGVLQSNSFMYLSFAVNAQNYVRVLNSRDATITLNYITLQYTKTADTPFTGIWSGFDTVSHKVFRGSGQLVKSDTTNVAAIGFATVNISYNLAEIDFSFKVTATSSSSSDFAWGLSVDKLREAIPELPNLKPIQGGFFYTNQSDYTDMIGYGSLMSETIPGYKYWIPTRIYTTSGDIGGWSSGSLKMGAFYFGKCYGEVIK